MHPSYNTSYLHWEIFDIALVKLIEPVIQSSDRKKLLKVNNICLPEKIENYELGINEYARIAGWGRQKRQDMEVGYLKYFTLR